MGSRCGPRETLKTGNEWYVRGGLMVAPFVLAHTDRLPFSRSVSLSVYNFSQACSRPTLARMKPHLDDTLLISPTIFCRIRGAEFCVYGRA